MVINGTDWEVDEWEYNDIVITPREESKKCNADEKWMESCNTEKLEYICINYNFIIRNCPNFPSLIRPQVFGKLQLLLVLKF